MTRAKPRFYPSGSISGWLEHNHYNEPYLGLCLAVILTDPGSGPCFAHELIDNLLGDGIAAKIETHYIGMTHNGTNESNPTNPTARG
jgi:hypothetical protein